MKKLLLSLIAVAGFTGLAYADEASFDFTKTENITGWGYDVPTKAVTSSQGEGTAIDTNTHPITSGDVNLAIGFGSATGSSQLRFFFPQNYPTVATKLPDLRCSANGGKLNQTLTFTAAGGAATITKIEFSGTVALKDAANKAISNNTWSGSAASVTLTTTGKTQIKQITVTYTPSGKQSADLSFDNQSVTVIQGETYAGQTVKNPNNLTVTYASDDENVAEVDANTGAITMGTELGTATITAKFAGNDQFAEGSASYTITVAKAVTSLAEFNAMPVNDEAVINCELTVSYADASNAYVTDGTDVQMLYQRNATYTYKAGDILNKGWKAKNVLYNNRQPEMEIVGALPTVKDGEQGTFTPEEISADDVKAENINKVAVLSNVEFAAATPSGRSAFTGKVGETEIAFYNKFSVASVAIGKYNVTGVVGINANTGDLQINPISFEAATTDGIDSIVADDAAEAEYYNLQGVRVAAPESGLYIVRRGNKVTKELVK